MTRRLPPEVVVVVVLVILAVLPAAAGYVLGVGWACFRAGAGW